MKQILTLLLAVSVYVAAVAQITVNSDITTSATWTNNNVYTLTGGFIYVRNGATLTIEPGTLIKGDASALVVARGSKLIAEGTATRPIVFTSSRPAGDRAPGDWGGILLLGNAPVNCPGNECVIEGGVDTELGKYGGTNPADNSGVLRYVRIEFGGIAFQPNNETNSLTLGGVGTGTTIEYVQTSYGGDDAFEWFGGTVNGKYLIAYKTIDDMFDIDFGYSGRNQFLLGVSDPNLADVSGSNGFESDNDGQGSSNTPFTSGIFSNATVLGPIQQPGQSINNNFKRAAHLRRNTRLSIYNSVLTGFPTGLRLESNGAINAFLNGDLDIKNTILAGMNTAMDSVDANFSQVVNRFNQLNNATLPLANLQLTTPFNNVTPNFNLQATSPLATGADFSAARLQGGFFTPTAYRGAFSTANAWTDCWAEFDPQNTNYSSAINYGGDVDFTFTVNEGTVSFIATAPVANAFTWNFGNGTNGSGATTNVTYAPSNVPITYDVLLTATTARGCQLQVTKAVTVPPVSSSVEVAAAFGAVTLFPNPTQQDANLQLTLPKAQTLTLNLYNSTGSLLSRQLIDAAAGTVVLPLATHNFNNGWYSVQVSNGKVSYALPLIIK